MKDHIGYLIIGGLLAMLLSSISTALIYRAEANQLREELAKDHIDYDVCVERIQQLTIRNPKK